MNAHAFVLTLAMSNSLFRVILGLFSLLSKPLSIFVTAVFIGQSTVINRLIDQGSQDMQFGCAGHMPKTACLATCAH